MAEQRPLIIVSDLHIGDGGPRDNFAFDGKAASFSRFLDYVQRLDGELLILGDLFDFWQSNIGAVLVERMSFIDRFAQMGATYVVGNHDGDFDALIGTKLLNHPFFERMTGPFFRTIGGKQFKFMHGHELDPFNQDGTPRWGRILAILGGIIEDKKGSPLLSAGGFTEKTLLKVSQSFMRLWNYSVNRFEKGQSRLQEQSYEEFLTPAQDPSRLKGILALYQKDRLANGYDILVAGHTHRVGIFDQWYVNCGCWVGLRSHFVKITPDGQPSIWEWKDGAAVKTENNGFKGI